MIKKFSVLLFLSLMVAACESNPVKTNDAKPSPATEASTPAPSPSVEAPRIVQWQAGDKVKVTVNGSVADATIVSIDEKAGKATIKVQGESKERSVNLADLVKP